MFRYLSFSILFLFKYILGTDVVHSVVLLLLSPIWRWG